MFTSPELPLMHDVVNTGRETKVAVLSNQVSRVHNQALDELTVMKELAEQIKKDCQDAIAARDDAIAARDDAIAAHVRDKETEYARTILYELVRVVRSN